MNQRITELSIAAAPVNSSIPQSEWNIPKEFIEKFAELIVRECAGYAFSDDQDHNAMLKHFGVGE